MDGVAKRQAFVITFVAEVISHPVLKLLLSLLELLLGLLSSLLHLAHNA